MKFRWILFFIPLSLFAHFDIEPDQNNKLSLLDLGNLGSVQYIYDDSQLQQVVRLSPTGEVLYTHTYHYDASGALLSESLIGNLGEIVYQVDEENHYLLSHSPYHTELCQYDEQNHLIRRTQDDSTQEFIYNQSGELLAEEKDVLCERNEKGNLIKKISPQGTAYFFYDEQSRLIKVLSDGQEINFSYDSEGNRISKELIQGATRTNETYLYYGINDIAILDDSGSLKQLRIPGGSPHEDILRPIALETADAVYAPIHDVQGNIIKLINIDNQEVLSLPTTDPFGRTFSISPTPWFFAGKHYDKETGLVYFGARYYDPEIKKWLTPDPLGTLQSPDLYQYCFNNPLFYCDPDGQFAIPLIGLAWGAGAALTFPLWGTGAAIVATSALVGWASYKAVQKGNELLQNHKFKQDQLKKEQLFEQIKRSKKKEIDSTLPKDPFNDPDWEDISHPSAKNDGHIDFKNRYSGEKIRLDKGKPGEPGHKGNDHYHRYNPNTQSNKDKYLDKHGNPVPKDSEGSHLYSE